MTTVSHAHPGPSSDGPEVGVFTSPGRARELGALALVAASDYANAAADGCGITRGLAAHRAGCAIQALHLVAETVACAACRVAPPWPEVKP